MNWRTNKEAAQDYAVRLGIPDGPQPVIVPFRAIWTFGGFAHAIQPGKLIGVVGMSGGGKTSFMETLADAWMLQGHHILWWGVEWSWQEMMDRTVQRYGGPSMEAMALHALYLHEKKLNKKQHLGKELTDQEQQNAVQITYRVQTWMGSSHMLEEPVSDLEQLLGEMGSRIDTLRAEGVTITVVVFDYLQLLDLYSARSESEKNSIALGKIKHFCSKYKVVGVVSSQVTKASSMALRAQNQKKDLDMDVESAQAMRSDKFNLVLMLLPIYEEDGVTLTEQGIIKVAKNSTGSKGKVKVYTDPKHLRWVDSNEGLPF